LELAVLVPTIQRHGLKLFDLAVNGYFVALGFFLSVLFVSND